MGKRILIVGGGVAGLSSAYYCAKRGHDVTVLDRASSEYEGCSYGNAGLIIPSHIIPLAAPGMVKLGLKYMFDPGSPFYIKPRLNRELLGWAWNFYKSATDDHVRRAAPLIRALNLASSECFTQLLSEANEDCELKRAGVINLCRTERGLEHEIRIARLAEQVGLRVEVTDAHRARDLLGGLRAEITGGVYYPEDSFLSPNRFMRALKRLVDDAGVKIEWKARATGWRTKGNCVVAVCTEAEEYDADEFVIAAGSWSPHISKGLSIHIPIEAGKGYSLTLPTPPRLPKIAAILSEARVAVTPMGNKLRFGGTMELAGLDERVSRRRVERIISAACAHFPDFAPADFEGIAPWHGLRPVTPDGLPYLGRTRRYANLTLAAGHAMMGFSLGPITGTLIAQILNDEPTSLAIELLSPDRFN